MTESVSKSLGVQLQAVNNTYSFGIGTKALKTATLKWDTCQMYVSRVHLTATKEQGDTLATEFNLDLKFKNSKLADLFSANSLLGDVTPFRLDYTTKYLFRFNRTKKMPALLQYSILRVIIPMLQEL